jgi:hypothetical protein
MVTRFLLRHDKILGANAITLKEAIHKILPISLRTFPNRPPRSPAPHGEIKMTVNPAFSSSNLAEVTENVFTWLCMSTLPSCIFPGYFRLIQAFKGCFRYSQYLKVK